MTFSKITSTFHKSIFSSHFMAYRVSPLQSSKLTFKNSKSDLLQLLFLRSYIKTSYSTKVNKEINKGIIKEKANLEKNESIKEKEKTIIEEGNKIKKTSRIFLGGIAFFILGDNIYSWYQNRYNKYFLNKTVEKRIQPDMEVLEDKLIHRPIIVKSLKEIFQPYEDQSSYSVICGEHGTGKTTLIKIALKEIGLVKDKNNKVKWNDEMGVIYVDIPINSNLNKFGDVLEKALNFVFVEHISYTKRLVQKIFGTTKDTLNDPKWERVMDTFKYSAEIYKKKYGKPLVIIYDNINRLNNKNPEILDILQDDAKDNAYGQKYFAVFVISEDSVLRKMQSRSAWSRADDPIEIGDFTETESLNYLIEKHKIDKAIAKEIYNLVGGRIADLNSVANKIKKGRSFDEIKKKILINVEDRMRTAKLFKTQDYHIGGKKVINALFNSKELSRMDFENFFEKGDDANKVLETNVFTYHPERDTITFQSRAVECYIQENKHIF